MTVNTTPVEDLHTEDGPTTETIFAGAVLTTTGNVVEDVPQLLVAVTEMLPDEADALQLVEMVLIPCPDVMDAPAGTVHMYVVPA